MPHYQTATNEALRITLGRPQLIFFTALDGPQLEHLLSDTRLLDELIAGSYSLAYAVTERSAASISALRTLNRHGIPLIAWLLLPAGDGFWLNVQNYPQAIELYRGFRDWAAEHQLQFAAVGLDIEPPGGEEKLMQQWSLRDIGRRFWTARENVLYPAARAAYTDLIAEIHHDGYEVHSYQLPLIADDRRAGTTTIQRALDIVDLPADVEVLTCYSSLPIARFGHDLQGALIISYGSSADSIGVGSTGSLSGSIGENLPPLSWPALERDLLLAARHTDTIYIFSLEGCLERDLLPRIASLDWDADPGVSRSRHMLLAGLRAVLLSGLLFVRFSRALIAWLGWIIAAVLFIQQLRRWWREHRAAAKPDLTEQTTQIRGVTDETVSRED
jgi:hypothetical protein